MKSMPKTEYDVRIIDNEDGTLTLSHVSRLPPVANTQDADYIRRPMHEHWSKWVRGNRRKVIRLLTKCDLIS